MEPTFYDEHHPFSHRGNRDVNHLKRSMTLDLKLESSAKRQKPSLGVASVLSSPDLNMLKLASPELEKLIIDNQNGLVTTTPTPSGTILPLFSRHVTQEQENYAQGFVEALNELRHGGDSSQDLNDRSVSSESSNSSLKGSSGPTFVSLENSHYPAISLASSLGGFVRSPADATQVKDEPQTVPNISSSPPVSPIDMEDQERIKLERKRQRNRLAASKCRRRKLERIARLEDKVKMLKTENGELASVVSKLKTQVYNLKEQVMDHVQSGCQIMLMSGQSQFQ